MLRKTTLIFTLCLLINVSRAQGISFDPFEGTSFHLPIKKYKLGYGPHVDSFDTLSTFTWTEISVSERETDIAFPDVPKTAGFGILFHTKAQIDSAACYEFVLNSDDGSLLYINDSLVIDNGGNHKMRAMRDTFLLNKGSYPMKIWYQQLYPTKYGMIFKASFAGSTEICSKRLYKRMQRLNLDEHLNFKTNRYDLDEKAKDFLDSIAKVVESFQSDIISFEGHTDNIGDFDSNQLLSLRRAEAVFNYLKLQVDFTEVVVNVKGYADSKPLSKGSSMAARARNRRVEIIIE